MANPIKPDPQAAETAEAADLRRKLVRRMAFAGLMIVMLLAILAVFDHLSAPDEAESSTPRFKDAVPVPKKELTQPVRPADPTTLLPASEPGSPAVPTVTAKPDSAAPTAEPVGPPAPPSFASQPVPPHARI